MMIIGMTSFIGTLMIAYYGEIQNMSMFCSSFLGFLLFMFGLVTVMQNIDDKQENEN